MESKNKRSRKENVLMGVQFSHCKANWMFNSYMVFRQALASEAGIRLFDMEGFSFGPGESWDTVDDDIVPLLVHSDHSGEFSVEECKTISPRLIELIDGWGENNRNKVQALILAEGMELAVKCNEPLRFV